MDLIMSYLSQRELLCVSDCRDGGFRCRTGVCVHKDAVGDGQMDCLDGEDESKKHIPSIPATGKRYIHTVTQTFLKQFTQTSFPHNQILEITETFEGFLVCLFTFKKG